MEAARRIDIQRLTPAETAIRNAMIAVEEVGADPLLTDAVILLQQARDKVADYVDQVPRQAVKGRDIDQSARRVANTVQMMAGCSDGLATILTRALTEFADEIRREAIEP